MLQGQDRLRVGDRGLDLETIAHNAWVGKQALDLSLIVARDNARVETLKRPTEVLALVEDRSPGETGLEDVQAQMLEQLAIIMHRPAPFGIMVGGHERFPVAEAALSVTH